MRQILRETEGDGVLRCALEADLPVHYSLSTWRSEGELGATGTLSADGDALMVAAICGGRSLVLQDGTSLDITITLADGDGTGMFEVEYDNRDH